MLSNPLNKAFVVIRSSSFIDYIIVNPWCGWCTVYYKNTNKSVKRYAYNNVSRRAIAKLLLEDTISLGSWVNKYCLAYDSKCADNFDANPLTLQSAAWSWLLPHTRVHNSSMHYV